MLSFRSREDSVLKQPLAPGPQSISVSADYKILNGRLCPQNREVNLLILVNLIYLVNLRYAYEARQYRTQYHAIPDIRYEYSRNSLIGIGELRWGKLTMLRLFSELMANVAS